MKITLLSDESIRLEPATGQLTIEAESADQEYSPYHMFASGLAVCTFGVLQSWGSNVGVSADDLVIDVSWSFAEQPASRRRDGRCRISGRRSRRNASASRNASRSCARCTRR